MKSSYIFGVTYTSKYKVIFYIYVFKQKEVKLDDKKFDVLLVKNPKNVFHRLYLLLKIISGKLDDKYIYYFQASELNLNAEKEINWTIDGEYGGKMKTICIENANNQIPYLTKEIL